MKTIPVEPNFETMKRISSRQRLVSWDAFDATVKDSDSDHAEVEEDYYLSAIATSTLNTKNEVAVRSEKLCPPKVSSYRSKPQMTTKTRCLVKTQAIYYDEMATRTKVKIIKNNYYT